MSPSPPLPSPAIQYCTQAFSRHEADINYYSTDLVFSHSLRIKATLYPWSNMPLPTDQHVVETGKALVETLQGVFGSHPGFRPGQYLYI